MCNDSCLSVHEVYMQKVLRLWHLLEHLSFVACFGRKLRMLCKLCSAFYVLYYALGEGGSDVRGNMKQLGIKCAILGILLSLFVLLIIAKGEALTQVHIKIQEGQDERMDKGIPFITAEEDKLPDYKLLYLVDDRWHTIGTIRNTSAQDWLRYTIADPPNLSLVKRVRVVEEDVALDDVLDEVAVADGGVSGTMFAFEFKSTRSFGSGMQWFFATPVGLAILSGVCLAVLVMIFAVLPLP